MNDNALFGVLLGLVFFAVLFGGWIALILWGIRLAKRKNRSPHWMWFGMHPFGLIIVLVALASADPKPPRSPRRAALPSPDTQMLDTLTRLCNAYTANDENEIARLEPLASQIGEELNRRGGVPEMRRIWNRLGNIRGSRTLDMHWDGIGDWRG